MFRGAIQTVGVSGLGLAAALVLAGCGGRAEEPSGFRVKGPVPHAGHEHGTTTPATGPTAQATDDYPLETCVVSGEKLGSMGEPVVIQHEGRTVKFCCQGCVTTFKKDPAKYLAILDKAKADREAAGHEGHSH